MFALGFGVTHSILVIQTAFLEIVEVPMPRSLIELYKTTPLLLIGGFACSLSIARLAKIKESPVGGW